MKRFLKLSALLLIFILIESVNYLGFLLDELFYSSYKKEPIKSPLFIVGMPRSGTTYLHNLLAKDAQRFTAMRLWEIILAPSVTQKKLVIHLLQICEKLNINLRKLLSRLDKEIFKDYSPIHPLSFFNIEEDDYLFFHILTSGHLLFWFPSITQFYKNIKFDHELSENNKFRQLRYYRSCIKKHLFVFGDGRVYLAKSPLHTPRLHSLKNFFPDAVFIYNIRAPHEVIPSTISLFQMFSRVFYTPVSIETLTAWVFDIADYWYTYALDQSKTIPQHRFINVMFSDLTINPKSEVESIYRILNYRASKHFRKELEEEVKTTKVYLSKHGYSLNQYKLDKDQIEVRYNAIYHEYFSNSNQPSTNVPVPLVTN